MSNTAVVKWVCDRNNKHTAYRDGPVEGGVLASPPGWTRVTREAIDDTPIAPSVLDLCEGCSRQLQSFLINKDNVPVVGTLQ